MRITSGIWLGLGVLFMGSMVLSCTTSSLGVYKKGHRLCAEHSAGAVLGVNTACFFKIHKGAVSNERGESGCGIRRSRHGG